MTIRKSSSSFLRTRPFLLHGSPSAVWMTRALPNSSSSGVVCLPTYLLTYPLAHLHTSTSTSLSYLPTYSLAYLLTYPLAHLLTYVLAQCGCLHLSYQESTIPQALCQADSSWDAGVQLQANWQVHRFVDKKYCGVISTTILKEFIGAAKNCKQIKQCRKFRRPETSAHHLLSLVVVVDC